jgi:glycosyltransferase involved in cell wall biosynthesis
MYPPHHAGGYELAWQSAMRCARELGHEVRILASDYRDQGKLAEEDPDVHRTLRWYWDLEHYEFPRLGPVDRLRLERGNVAELDRHLDEFRPDLVAWWSMGCMSLGLIERARRAGIPAVFVVHDDWLVYGWQHDQWIRSWHGPRRGRLAPVVERVCGVPARVELEGRFVFNSRYTLERARRTGLELADATVVHPGIDERFLEPVPERAWGWRIAYIGRIDRQKGIDTVVAALQELPAEATLSLWGSGDERYIAELKALARELGAGERVTFHGFVESARLRSAYEAADVVVFPVRWEEPFGLVPLEAMGLGRPVVTTARGGTAEFVRDGENALVIPPDDHAALSGALARLAGDDPLRGSLREGGRRTAAEHTAHRFASDTVAQIVRAARG